MRRLYSTLAVLAAAALTLPGAANAQAKKLTIGIPDDRRRTSCICR